jgi:indole-3-glycerol phosphate synthase
MSWNRDNLLAACNSELRQLAGQGVSEVTPSRHDFGLYVSTQRQGLAVIARLASGPRAALIDLARVCDKAEVAALSLALGDDLSLTDVAAVAHAITAPIMREAFVVDANQLYHARLHGADAALFPVAELGGDALRLLVAVASSLHMASIAEVRDAASLEVAMQLPRLLLGIACVANNGAIDVDATLALAAGAPQGSTIVVLPALSSVAEADALRGAVDAVVLAETLLAGADAAAIVDRAARGE